LSTPNRDAGYPLSPVPQDQTPKEGSSGTASHDKMVLPILSEVSVARITRKELKSDKFAQEVGLTVDFFEEHQKDVVRYGGIGVAVALLIAGFMIYQRHEHAARQEELAQAIRIQETPVATLSTGGQQTYQTQDAKDQAAIKAFSDLTSKHGGSDEAQIAEYYLGSIHADEGKLAEAEKNFLDVATHGDKNYASLAKASLAELYFSDGRFDQGEKTLRDLIANPTVFVSKEEASIALARHLSGRNNAEARKLLAPIKDGKSQVATVAQQMYSQLPPQ
jgi:predicted negative regulator of RcsB-dependent stress response